VAFAPPPREYPPVSHWLVDTGPLVAALNRRDPQHARCAAALAEFEGTLVTTGAVVTEAMHFLSSAPDGGATLTGFLEEARVEIRDCFSVARMRSAAALMRKYHDVPMDFADATLVVLAEEVNIGEILTLDERGFRTYRYRGNRRFCVLPGSA
jgi:uncharacterized protein